MALSQPRLRFLRFHSQAAASTKRLALLTVDLLISLTSFSGQFSMSSDAKGITLRALPSNTGSITLRT